MARTALVTGANKGIGLAIVRNLALQYPSSTLNNGPLLIYLTARDQSRGEAALQSLQDDAQLVKAKALASHGGSSTIRFRGMDVSKPESIDEMGHFLKREHPEGIDIVVNNAGIALNGFDNSIVQQTLLTNYHGTLHATRTFLPLLRPHGRLVNVASAVGKLYKYSPDIQSRFLASTTVPEVTALMDDFTLAVKAGREREEGWPSAAYAVSKAGVIAMTRAIAREEMDRNTEAERRLVNSCCPGFVRTDMTKDRGVKTVDQGAETPVFLALGEYAEAGEFWEQRGVSEW